MRGEIVRRRFSLVWLRVVFGECWVVSLVIEFLFEWSVVIRYSVFLIYLFFRFYRFFSSFVG